IRIRILTTRRIGVGRTFHLQLDLDGDVDMHGVIPIMDIAGVIGVIMAVIRTTAATLTITGATRITTEVPLITTALLHGQRVFKMAARAAALKACARPG